MSSGYSIAGDGSSKAGSSEQVVDPAQETMRYVARQPIMDERGLHGYELLFRCGPASRAFCGNGESATRTVLDNAMTLGLERLTGGMPAFVNCTQESLEERLVMVLPPDKTVLELLETLQPTDALWHACRELKGHGYRVALDDFMWRQEWMRFFELADYVKVDLSITSRAERSRIISMLRGNPAALIAERVETQQDLEMARSEGFRLFQGYYFSRPVLMEGRAIPANRLVHLELLLALQDEPLDTQRISALVKRDASLTYRLLRLVNSPLYGVGKEVRSIHAALVMVGDAMFRRVATLAIAAELQGGRSNELLRMAFLRGRFCELAAALTGEDSKEQYLLGILSLLPAMLQVPMETIAGSLPLRAEMRSALLGINNRQRVILNWVMSYEQCAWERCDALAREIDVSLALLPEIYVDSMLWAETNLGAAADGCR